MEVGTSNDPHFDLVLYVWALPASICMGYTDTPLFPWCQFWVFIDQDRLSSASHFLTYSSSQQGPDVSHEWPLVYAWLAPSTYKKFAEEISPSCSKVSTKHFPSVSSFFLPLCFRILRAAPGKCQFECITFMTAWIMVIKALIILK